jgi:GTP-binding protein
LTKPVVAIIGRQNVGKSTLLNRLSGQRISIVEDLPGTTRDRVFATVDWLDHEFTLVDTGGLEIKADSGISKGVNDQIKAALDEADVIIFLVDVRDGVTPDDYDIAEMLRKTGKPLVLVVNKADNDRFEAEAVAFYELGLGEPITISAQHGRGTGDLLDKLVSMLPGAVAVETPSDIIKVAIVGRPNVGKSALLNVLLGQERVIVSDIPGTTRDAIDTIFDFNGQNMLLIDTAGIRRRGRFGNGVERYSVVRALRAIERADVVLLVIDASEPLTAQDMHIAGYIHQMTKGIVLVVNKWDLITEKNIPEWEKRIKSELKFMPYAPTVYISAKTGSGIDKVMPEVCKVYHERVKRLSTSEVNSVVHKAAAAHSLTGTHGKQLKILYATQAEVNPPTFVFFVNDPKLIHFSYQRYLENKLRQSFGFAGTPLRLVFKARGE